MAHENRSLKVVLTRSQYSEQYSASIRLGCPWCKIDTSHKSRVYKSLKSLLYHISQNHKCVGDYYPFKLDDIKLLMQNLALAKEWRLLV